MWGWEVRCSEQSPKWRMRTKPLGRTWIRNRLRNSWESELRATGIFSAAMEPPTPPKRFEHHPLRILYELLTPFLRAGLSNWVQGGSTTSVAGDAMRVVMAMLCMGSVTLFLSVLVAPVKEWVRSTHRFERFHAAKFHSARTRGELIVMDSENRNCKLPPETDERMAI